MISDRNAHVFYPCLGLKLCFIRLMFSSLFTSDVSDLKTFGEVTEKSMFTAFFDETTLIVGCDFSTNTAFHRNWNLCRDIVSAVSLIKVILKITFITSIKETILSVSLLAVMLLLENYKIQNRHFSRMIAYSSVLEGSETPDG